MIDQDLSRELHAMAAVVDEPLDLGALHRRISSQNRRRAVGKVGLAGAGVAAIVAGLVVVRPHQDLPAGADSPAASSLPSPGCDALMAAMDAKPPAEAAKRAAAATAAADGDVEDIGFKGLVTVAGVDGARLSFVKQTPADPSHANGVATLDAGTEWVDGANALAVPAALHTGDLVGLAVKAGADGVDHAVFVDVGATANAAATQPADPKATAETSDVPGPAVPVGATDKAHGTVIAVHDQTVSLTLDDGPDAPRTVAIDTATTPFYAGATACTPVLPTVGTQWAVAYHAVGDALVVDAVMVLP